MSNEPERLKQLFAAASVLQGEARSEFLDRECGRDSKLRGRLVELLFAHDNSSGLLATRSAILGDDSATPPTSDLPARVAVGTVIAGRYTLVQEIGEGGMGQVWVAQQSEPVKRRVALKLVKRDWDSEAMLRRFEQERQALALMDHPHIARVYDGGVTENGQPYFVMELVNGLPLNKYCDEARLSPQQRLELFIPICQAVQHAHHKGIIHRDLKPANILVTLIDGRPHPKVIDFGIAKSVSGKITDEALTTQFGAVLGTFEYMSPEQAGWSGQDVDTRSDIYSLGVILYELLTGLRPIDAARLRRAALAEAIRMIQEDEPPRPSTRLSTSESLPSLAAVRQVAPQRLMEILRGELDWIVMRCLEKSRERRYETANGLVRDIERYLRGDPVEACPPSFRYRFGKLARRHRVAIGTLGAFVALLAAATGTSTVLAVWARREQRQADEQRQQADELRQRAEELRAQAEEREKDAVDGVRRFRDAIVENQQLRDQAELQPLRARLLEEALRYFRELRDRLSADQETNPQSLPRLARAALDVAILTERLDDPDQAIELYNDALRMFEEQVRDDPSNLDAQFDLGECLTSRAEVLRATKQADAAIESLRSGIKLLEEVAKARPQSDEAQVALARALHWLGAHLRSLSKFDEAQAAYERAIAIERPLAEKKPVDKDRLQSLASSIVNLGNVARQRERRDEALEYYRQAREVYERLLQTQPGNGEYQLAIALGQLNLAGVYLDLGKSRDAIAELTDACAKLQWLADANASNPKILQHLASAQFNLGISHQTLGDHRRAVESFEQAERRWTILLQRRPKYVDYLRGLVVTRSALVQSRMALRDTATAIEELRKVRELREQLVAENPSVPDFQAELAKTLGELANFELGRRDIPAALRLHQESTELLEGLAERYPRAPEYRYQLSVTQINEGRSLGLIGRADGAIRGYQRAIDGLETLVREFPGKGPYKATLVLALSNLGNRLRSKGDFAESLARLRRARELVDELVRDYPELREYDEQRAALQSSLARTYHLSGNLQRARGEFASAVDLQRQLIKRWGASPEFSSSLGGTLHNFAMVDLDENQTMAAQERLLEAERLQRQAVDAEPENPTYRQFLENHLASLLEVGRKQSDTTLVLRATKDLAALKLANPEREALLLRLKEVEEGKTPSGAPECLKLAEGAYSTQRYSVATRLYERAFQIDSKLVDDREAQHAYNAACVAALATAATEGPDAALDPAARIRLRTRALEWLEEELLQWRRHLVKSGPSARKGVAESLGHWLKDPDLASLRDTARVEALPDDERPKFQAVWKGVEELLQSVSDSSVKPPANAPNPMASQLDSP